MSAHFPENVYRSPYEWISVAAYSTTEVSVAHLPVPPVIAYGSLAIFLWFASQRMTDFVTPQNSIRQRENMRLRQWVQTGFPA